MAQIVRHHAKLAWMVGQSWLNYDRTGRAVRGARSGGFQSAHLNLVGWSAVLLPGVVLGVAAGALSGTSLLLSAVVGMALTWAIALALDFIAWRKIPFGISNSLLSVDQASVVVARLRERGLKVDLEETVDPDSGCPAWRIRSVNRHRRVIERAIEVGTGDH